MFVIEEVSRSGATAQRLIDSSLRPLRRCVKEVLRGLHAPQSLARLQKDLDQYCGWPNQEQRVERRMHHLIQPQQHLHERHEEHDDALPLPRLHRRLRIRDHEENEELVHRSRDRRDLSPPRITRDPTTQERKRKK